MRIVIHLNDYQPAGNVIHDAHCVDNPTEAGDDRAVVPDIDVEWYPGGGNIHLLDARVTEVAKMMDGSVLVRYGDDEHRIENADLATVYSEGPSRQSEEWVPSVGEEVAYDRAEGGRTVVQKVYERDDGTTMVLTDEGDGAPLDWVDPV